MPTTLRDRLIEIADELGNDAEFARIAKVSRSAVSQWRKGDVHSLKAMSAVNIQERTGYSVRWLILGIGPKKVGGKLDVSAFAHKPEIDLSTADGKRLLALLKGFLETDAEGRDQIVEAVEAITGNGSGEEQRTSKRRGGGAPR